MTAPIRKNSLPSLAPLATTFPQAGEAAAGSSKNRSSSNSRDFFSPLPPELKQRIARHNLPRQVTEPDQRGKAVKSIMDLANTSRINRGNLKEEKELAMMCWKNLFKSRSDESEPFTLENFLEILENPRDIKPEAGDQPFKPFKTPCIKDIKPPQLKTEGLIVAAKAIEKLPSTDRANAFKATLEFARAAGLPKEDLASVLQQLSETIKNEDEDLASALRQEARNTTKGLPGEAGFLLDQLFTHDFLHDFLPDFDSILQQTRELPKSEKKAFLLQNLSNVHGVEITLPPLLRQEACDAMKGLPGEADLLYRQIDYFRFKKHITQKIIEVSAYKTVSDEEAKQLGLFGSHFIG